MSVTKQNTRNAYLANPGATSFPFDFKINDKSDLLVTVDGQVQRVDIDFTVVGVGSADGGSVIFSAGRQEDEFVVIRRNMTFQRLTDYQQLGDLRSGTLNADIDNVVMMLQQLDGHLSQSLRLGDSYVAVVNPLMPKPEPFALLGWNSTATGLMNTSAQGFAAAATAGVPFTVNVTEGQTEIPLPGLKAPWSPQAVFYNGIFQDPGAYTVTPSGITFSEPLPADGKVVVVAVFGSPTQITESDALTFKLQSADSVTRPVRDKLGETVSVKDFGAVGDGATDDTANLQKAIDSGARELFWPAGVYLTSGTLKPAHNQSWVGAAGQTRIQLSPAAPSNAHVIAHNTDGLDGPLQNFSMSGFTVDGSAKEGGLVLYGCQRLRLTDCVFQNCETYGLGLQARPGFTIDEPQDDIVMTRCQFNNNGGGTVWDGLDVKHCTNTVLEACSATGNTDAGLNLRGSNLDLIGCQAVGNGTAGILLQSNYDAGVDSYIRVVGGQAYGTTGGPGLELQGNTGNNTFVEVSAFQSYGNTGAGVRISGSGKVTGNITALQSRDNTLHGVEVTGDYSGSLSFNGGLFAGNGGDGFRTAGKGAVLNGVALLNNTGAGYREVTGADNNYLMATCVVSGNGSNITTRVGVEADAGFLSVRTALSMRAFPGQASGVELQTDGAGAHSTVAAVGAAASVDLRLVSQGNGNITGYKSAGARILFDFKEEGSAIVNYPEMTASLTGGAVLYGVAGADTNIDLQLNAKGTGRVRFGTLTATADAPVTGYITIKDSGGTERKLAVIA